MRCSRLCWPCIVHDLVSAVDLSFPSDWETRMDALYRCLRAAEEAFSPSSLPSEPITLGHRVLNCFFLSRFGSLPFASQRGAANRAALALCERVVGPQLRKEASWEGRILLLLRWCAAGNCADFRSVATEAKELKKAELERRLSLKFERAFSEGLYVDQSQKIASLLAKANTVAIVHDNCGEIAFDSLLARELSEAGKEVISIVHGPISSDADLEDAEEVRLPEFAQVLSTRRPTLGLILSDAGREALSALSKAEAIIVKGQANFYQFFEPGLPVKRETTVVSVMRTKCKRAFLKFGLKENRNVAAILRPS